MILIVTVYGTLNDFLGNMCILLDYLILSGVVHKVNLDFLKNNKNSFEHEYDSSGNRHQQFLS